MTDSLQDVVAELVESATRASATLSHIWHTTPLTAKMDREAYADFQRLNAVLEKMESLK